MASVAERTRRRRARTAAAARTPALKVVSTPATTATPKYQRRNTGLIWLANKGKIDAFQRVVGERYGRDYRFSIMESGVALKSSLDIDGVFGGGKGGGLPVGSDYSAWIIEARAAITLARAAVGFHDGMVLALDLVCGRQLTPREITPVQKEAEEIETSLRLALDLVGRHYGAVLDSKSF